MVQAISLGNYNFKSTNEEAFTGSVDQRELGRERINIVSGKKNEKELWRGSENRFLAFSSPSPPRFIIRAHRDSLRCSPLFERLEQAKAFKTFWPISHQHNYRRRM